MEKPGWDEKEKIEVPLYRPGGAEQEQPEKALTGMIPLTSVEPVPELPMPMPEPEPELQASVQPAAATLPREEKGAMGWVLIAAATVCALILTVVLAVSLSERSRMNEHISDLENRLNLLESGSGTAEEPLDGTEPSYYSNYGTGEFTATDDDVEMVGRVLSGYASGALEIVGIMDYTCDFDGYWMDAILIKTAPLVHVNSPMVSPEYILIDRADGTVLDYRDIVYPEPGTPVAGNYEDARDILYWAFSCRPPEVAWNDFVWSEMETRRTWTREEVDAVRAMQGS